MTEYTRRMSYWFGSVFYLLFGVVLPLAAFFILWFHPNLYSFDILTKIIGTVILALVFYGGAEFFFAQVTKIEIAGNAVMINFLFKKEEIAKITGLTIQTPRKDFHRHIRRSLRIDYSKGTVTINHIFEFTNVESLFKDLENVSKIRVKQVDLRDKI